MKGKLTWKPVGLGAKKWRAPAYAKESGVLLSSKLLKQEQARQKPTSKRPFEKPTDM
jgi:hypothetical protein